jgi:GT2 family glycosyltransferase
MIHVLTLTWNGLHHLTKLRPGLLKNLEKTGEEFKWHIRSNGCTDGTVEEISSWDEVDVLSKNHNRGNFSAGVNSICKQAAPKDEDLLLLLNNDIVFKDDMSLTKMLSLMKKTGAAVCGSRMMFPDSDIISHIGVIFSKQKGNMPWHLKLREKLNKNDKKDRYFQAVTAACCFVKADAFKIAGMMDTSYHWAFEDIDLCLDVKYNQNKKIVCCCSTEIDHETSASLVRNNLNKLFLANNVSHFKSKWYGKYKIDHDLYIKSPRYNEVK